jgi:hypothetical protein
VFLFDKDWTIGEDGVLCPARQGGWGGGTKWTGPDWARTQRLGAQGDGLGPWRHAQEAWAEHPAIGRGPGPGGPWTRPRDHTY